MTKMIKTRKGEQYKKKSAIIVNKLNEVKFAWLFALIESFH